MSPVGAGLRAFAPAKVNLTLHVLGRRPDGFHDLDSLVAFADVGDDLVLDPGPALSLAVEGPEAGATGPTVDNLVLKAARALMRRAPGLRTGRFTLVKRLPVAAGLGGGSADAAAALRLLATANALAPDDRRLHEAAAETGSDVPVCLDPRARRMRGRGDAVGPPLLLGPFYALLVNCRVACPTGAVFAALGLRPGERFIAETESPGGDLAEIPTGRNDLDGAARRVAPAIDAVFAELERTPGRIVCRLSGSGATCFALYPDRQAAKTACDIVSAAGTDWWCAAATLA